MDVYSNSAELLSLQLQYEQVCIREREASSRNLSFKRDIARVSRKLADLSLEMKIKRLQLIKKEYEESVYATWLAETSILKSHPYKNNGAVSSGAIPNFSQPMPSQLMASPLPSQPTASASQDLVKPSFNSMAPSLRPTAQFLSERPMQTMPAVDTQVSASLNSSLQVRFSTGISPISHPAPFVPPSSAPGVEPSFLSASLAHVSAITSTTLSTADHTNLEQQLTSSSSSLSNSPPPHQVLSVPLPDSSPIAFNNSDQSREASLLSSTSSLLSCTHTSLSISPRDDVSGTHEDILEQEDLLVSRSLEPTRELEIPEDNEEMSLKDEMETEGASKVIRIDIPRQEEESLLDEAEEEEKETGEQENSTEEREDEDQNVISVDFKVKPTETKKSELDFELQSDSDKGSHSISSISSVPDLSHAGMNPRIQIVPPGASSEEHMSAYYKLVGKLSDQGKSPALSQSSEESDLEGNLRLAVTKSLDNEDELDEDDLLLLPDKSPITVEGLVDLKGNNVSTNSEQKPTKPPLSELSEHRTGAAELKKPFVDNNSLKRRMGIYSSSEDESDDSIAAGVSATLYKSPRDGKNNSSVANLGNDIDDDDDDDDDFDFYS